MNEERSISITYNFFLKVLCSQMFPILPLWEPQMECQLVMDNMNGITSRESFCNLKIQFTFFGQCPYYRRCPFQLSPYFVWRDWTKVSHPGRRAVPRVYRYCLRSWMLCRSRPKEDWRELHSLIRTARSVGQNISTLQPTFNSTVAILCQYSAIIDQ